MKKSYFIVFVVFASLFFGVLGGFFASYYFEKINLLPRLSAQKGTTYVAQTTQEDKIISAVKNVSPAVVSVIISKDLPVIEQYYTNPFGDLFGIQIPQQRQVGTKKQEIGGGTGFIISADGMIVTNKHVVEDKEADYTVLTNDGKRYAAQVVAKDPIQDIAVIKIEKPDQQFKTVPLGDSAAVQIGQSVIAIGNALGEFKNTVSVGVISGLGRTITASGGETAETLDDVIQTDAAINKGNSGGPLLNLKGEVIGINSAIASDAQSVGFSIPINSVKRSIEQARTQGKIVYPFLGVSYTLVNDQVQKDNKLTVNYGAWIKSSDSQAAIVSGSAAEKAGLKEGDIILEINNEKITTDNSLSKIILKYKPQDKVTLKILHEGKDKIVEVVLGERS